MSQSKQLSYDVVFDILTRLPVKSLVRFRCVSNSWNSIISSHFFINTHLDRAKSLSHNNNNNNGYLLDTSYNSSSPNDLCTVVYYSDRTLTEISMLQMPLSDVHMVDFCNGIFCLRNYETNELYLWNPSIRKLKMLSTIRLAHSGASYAIGLGYHSQNNDFKFLRIVYFEGSKARPAEAEVYTLSTDSWRKFVISLEYEPNIGSINRIDQLRCLFFNGALHSIVFTGEQKFILSFDVNDERFREIMLPQNYVDEKFEITFDILAVFKGSLASFVCIEGEEVGDRDICYMWVMREYGVVESWTKINVPLHLVNMFFGCTDSGELLIDINDSLVSYDTERQYVNNLGIEYPTLLSYTTDLMENLVLLDQKYPSLPSWEVQVTNDSGEGGTMIVPRSKHVPYVPWTGGVEADFVEECYSLIGSMKSWISSSSQSSFAHINKLSHEIDLLRNRVESQASTIRTLEAGGSSDPVPDAAGAITSPADEGNPMNTTVQSKEGSSQSVKRLAPERPSHPQVRESTTLATLRSKSGHLHSGKQITLDDDEEEDEEDMEDATPLVQRQSKRGRL
ncbi:F-box/kelch-repeat protein At3g06240-like isoform X1 [Fagus crenata]